MKNINEIEYQEMINSDKLSVIKYFGTWCGPCRVLSPILDGIVKEYPNINAGEVNIDVHSDLAIKDGIRGVPTVVFYKNGEVVDRMVGLQPAQAYTQKINSLLNSMSKVFLIDIDGTICDDIKNEESYLFPTAKPIDGSKEIINKWYDEGNVITFFTARESKDREVTETWLKDNGFKYHGLVMDKPRIKDGQEYVWIDNRKVRAITYLGTWSELKEVQANIQVFS